jgi:3-oxoacyl-(acyl-carrier-protein) synthase
MRSSRTIVVGLSNCSQLGTPTNARSTIVTDLAEPVRALADPQGRSRQFVAARLGQLAGTRAGGFVLTREEAAGKWGAATYALVRT